MDQQQHKMKKPIIQLIEKKENVQNVFPIPDEKTFSFYQNKTGFETNLGFFFIEFLLLQF